MHLPDRADITAAHDRIAAHVRRTPVLRVEADAFGSHPPLVLKLELTQHAGSFKARGAFNTLLSGEVPAAGVAAASGGNHGAAVAFAARRLGIPARIFVPEIASAAKIGLLKAIGADLVITGADYAEALAACEAHIAETGAGGIHAYDAFETIAGQGTLAREWAADGPDCDVFVVSVGGGGLIGGFAAWHGDAVRLVAAETEGTRAFASAREAGAPVDVQVSGIAADSLGARRIGTHPFALLERADVTSVIVSDAEVSAARALLWERCRILCEPGAATALAAGLSGRAGLGGARLVGILICGGNTQLQPDT